MYMDHGRFVVEDKDISAIWCYRDRDGIHFEDGFRFEMQLQDIVIYPGSIHTVELPAELAFSADKGIEDTIRAAIYQNIGFAEEESI
ncbi:hypothetical protein [Paenibacillus bovis]|uniref:Uncharacterized protein n=1 Tax=Paenibacillus bovis TaxID=1616788 RepID=A0A172ZF33_9BACL|nr:hypothetical protein [Paenibacillus bovis]ANF96246.1 hypothetical protein AR543_09705 [Paenibacillus bovis]